MNGWVFFAFWLNVLSNLDVNLILIFGFIAYYNKLEQIDAA